MVANNTGKPYVYILCCSSLVALKATITCTNILHVYKL